MMPQKEVNEAMNEQAGPAYGGYEGNQTSSAHPIPRDNTNILRFALAVISLGLVLLFGLLFIVVIGGTTGWASFAVACFAIFIIGGVGIISIK